MILGFGECQTVFCHTISRMRALTRLLVFLCLAAVLFAALTQPGAVAVLAILAPFWFFLALIVSRPLPDFDDACAPLPLLVLPVFSPRPPPLQ